VRIGGVSKEGMFSIFSTPDGNKKPTQGVRKMKKKRREKRKIRGRGNV
jgi:hypothetical protein